MPQDQSPIDHFLHWMNDTLRTQLGVKSPNAAFLGAYIEEGRPELEKAAKKFGLNIIFEPVSTKPFAWEGASTSFILTDKDQHTVEVSHFGAQREPHLNPDQLKEFNEIKRILGNISSDTLNDYTRETLETLKYQYEDAKIYCEEHKGGNFDLTVSLGGKAFHAHHEAVKDTLAKGR